MVEVPSIAVFIICLIGCSVQSFFLGKRYGIQDCLDYLQQEGVIDLEEEEDEL